EPGTSIELALHDGSKIVLKKLGEDYDPTDRRQALAAISEAKQAQHLLTGLLFLDESRPTLQELLNLTDEPLSRLSESKLRPPKEALDQIMRSLQ
ncbi:MAG TPA: hypothetical protein V6D22_23115, partial [Candidatus Obscuribacterales bacterium]